MEKWDVYDENMNKTEKVINFDEKLKTGEYHLSIHVWIKNINDNRYLLQKRADTLNHFPNMWSVVTGGVVSGERGLDAVLRETNEEIGITLNIENLEKIAIVKREFDFVEIWKLEQKIDLDKLKLQKEELSEVKLLSGEEIKQMIENGLVAPSIIDEFYKYF